MTITVSNRLGGQKIGDSTYSYGTTNYGFSAQTFTGDDATKQAQFQFDLERPTHCLLENNLADVIDRSANCTVFPIALDEDITTVSLNIFYVVWAFMNRIYICIMICSVCKSVTIICSWT